MRKSTFPVTQIKARYNYSYVVHLTPYFPFLNIKCTKIKSRVVFCWWPNDAEAS